MLSLNLMPIFNARGIERPFSFLVKKGFSTHAAHNLLSGSLRSFRLDHIERLCSILVCDPNDLLHWTPQKDENYPADHPLFKLNQLPDNGNIKQTLATMPYKQLKEITLQISGEK